MGSSVDRFLSEQRQGRQPQGPPANFDQKSKVDSVLTAKPTVDDILGGGQTSFDPNRLLPRQVAIPEGADDGLLSQVFEILKEQGRSLVQFGKYAITTPGFNGALPVTTLNGKLGEDILAAAGGDKEAELRTRRGLEGAALAGSTIAAEGAIGIKFAQGVAPSLMKRFARWMAAQELGAVTYGSIEPLDDDETRADVIREEMIAFPIAGAVMHGLFKGIGRAFRGFRGVSPEVEAELKSMGKEDAQSVATRMRSIYEEAGPPPAGSQADAALQSEALETAVRELRAGRKATTVTAKLVDETPLPTAPDFTVEITPPPPKPIPTNPLGTTLNQAVNESEATRFAARRGSNLGPISEQQFQQELEAITPKAPPVVDADATARARVEAARTTPFPDIPGGITVPTDLDVVMREAAGFPDSPVAQGAVADAVSDAVVAETSPLEIMAREMTEQATKQAAKLHVARFVKETNWTLKEVLREYTGGYDKNKQAIVRRIANRSVEREGFIDGDPPYAEVEAELDALAGGSKGPSQPLHDIGRVGEEPKQRKGGYSGMSEEGLDDLRKATERFLNSDAGAISARAATRIAATALSGASFYAAEQAEDPQAQALLNTVGGILALGSLVPGNATRQWLKDSKFGYWLIKSFDIGRIASNGTKEGMEAWQGATQQGRAFGKMLERKLTEVFPDNVSKEGAMFSLDEGPMAPEFAMLTKDQQKEVASQSVLNNVMGRILVQMGIIPHARAHYVRHLFRDHATQQLWYSNWQALGKSGQFAKQRQFETLREAIKWAKANGKAPPVMDPAVAQAFHVLETTRSIANVQIADRFKQLGMLQPYSPQHAASTGSLKPSQQWRQVRVTNLADQMAPDDVATILERIAGTDDVKGEWLKAMDAAKAQIMRGIMFWAWEHGINVLRGAAAIDGTGAVYRESVKRLRQADPVVMQVAKYADLFRRPDFGPEGPTLFDKMLEKIGKASPTLKKIGVGFEDFRTRGERKLWDETVPALGITAWSSFMHKWTERTGGKHLLGSPEYESAAKQAGAFANRVMGKVPELTQHPQVEFIMRQALFSPQWSRTRLSIMAHAAGDLQKIAAGEIKPNEATYLSYKLRSVLVGIALTAAASYALTGEWPKFNPNTFKFYMRTGVKDQNGREIGVDLTGWWQDDLKVMNDPWAFLRDRQNPFLRVVGTQINGRDVFGRPITGVERVENLVQSVGPMGELVSGALSAATQGELHGAEAIRMASGVAAVGNVASLPRSADAIVSKMASKLLKQAGLPDDKDRVFELSRLMRQNYFQQGTLYGQEVNTWLAYQRRAYQRRGIPWLWQEGKRVLGDMAK